MNRVSTGDVQLKSYHAVDSGELDEPTPVVKITNGSDDGQTSKKPKKERVNSASGASECITSMDAGLTVVDDLESQWLTGFMRKYGKFVSYAIKALLLGAYIAFVVFTFLCNFGDKNSIWVLVITCFVVFGFAMNGLEMIIDKSEGCSAKLLQMQLFFMKHRLLFGRLIAGICSIVVFTMIVIMATRFPLNLVSLSGVAAILLVCYVGSRYRKRIVWRIVIAGIITHQLFALFIIQVPIGATVLLEVGNVVEVFFGFAGAGAEFVFGVDYAEHPFAFSVMPALVFFCGVISVLYYYGLAQWLIKKLAIGLEFVLGASPVQCVVAVGNIFLGQTESAMLVRPVLDDVTNSELHAILLSGFATVAGSILSAYIFYGVKASHLIGASLMAAPASLVIANMLYPETEQTKVDKKYLNSLPIPDFTNIFHAFSAGASNSIKIVGNIVVNLIAFISALAMVNGILAWIGECVCLSQPLTFELICSYLFWPIPLLMGVPPEFCQKIARLIGVKLFINELVAYSQLGVLIENTNFLLSHNATIQEVIGDNLFLPEFNRTLVGGVIDKRSETIATYALCGFANLGSVGLQIGGVGAIAPNRKADLARLAFIAMLGGNLASFFSACVAGVYSA